MQKILTKSDYQKYVNKKSKNSKLFRNMARAFIVGGVICVLGQLISDLLRRRGYDKDTVSSITSMILIFLGAFFTGINIYDDLGRFAGAGSIVPITGFANSIVSPAMEFKSEGYITGVGVKMFLIAGPVLVFGISSSVVAGVIYYLLTH